MTDARRATVNRGPNGDRLGATVMLGDEDLEELGIESDADEIEYAVEDGRLRVREAEREALLA